ncbi:MAG: hypothetical protein N4A38_01230 [Candidatus Gracilibacteria bacterium]|nr:hypothetical protein [Candidatus Gracilibacteria bacterium]
MKNEIIETVKQVFSGISVGVFVGSIGGGLMNLYNFTKTGKFKLSLFIISICIGGFVGYITSEFTDSGAIMGISGALSMKLFDIASENGFQILKKFIGENIEVKIKK